jgi:hypothetical protein
VLRLSMGRRADCGDGLIYPMRPSRYCIGLDQDEVPAWHGPLPDGHVGFMWQVVLDGLGFQLEGGYLDPSRDRWMVWAVRI